MLKWSGDAPSVGQSRRALLDLCVVGDGRDELVDHHLFRVAGRGWVLVGSGGVG